jgi:hypothetical protein
MLVRNEPNIARRTRAIATIGASLRDERNDTSRTTSKLTPAQRFLKLRILSRPDAQRRKRAERAILAGTVGASEARDYSPAFAFLAEGPRKGTCLYGLTPQVEGIIRDGSGPALLRSLSAFAKPDTSQRVADHIMPFRQDKKRLAPLPSALRRKMKELDLIVSLHNPRRLRGALARPAPKTASPENAG